MLPKFGAEKTTCGLPKRLIVVSLKPNHSFWPLHPNAKEFSTSFWHYVKPYMQILKHLKPQGKIWMWNAWEVSAACLLEFLLFPSSFQINLPVVELSLHLVSLWLILAHFDMLSIQNKRNPTAHFIFCSSSSFFDTITLIPFLDWTPFLE